jgi:hypothetical protein
MTGCGRRVGNNQICGSYGYICNSCQKFNDNIQEVTEDNCVLEGDTNLDKDLQNSSDKVNNSSVKNYSVKLIEFLTPRFDGLTKEQLRLRDNSHPDKLSYEVKPCSSDLSGSDNNKNQNKEKASKVLLNFGVPEEYVKAVLKEGKSQRDKEILKIIENWKNMNSGFYSENYKVLDSFFIKELKR